jgi:hypothetical protein
MFNVHVESTTEYTLIIFMFDKFVSSMSLIAYKFFWEHAKEMA